ncbi:MAG: CBS domain-containing protein [Archaeoglobaceae archaeon]|nr:CBS domain-containing protein [Archaeoglobaceae archaeon]MCX8151999.1 CBS domain-containing protein [Archaeoglobaceae archaeon]MDW8013388.1 CBS domain-containing protein [Archaeoglobaceae archaeon]
MRALDVGTREVFTIPRSSTIMNAIKMMISKRFRRIPITDAGTKRLEGIISATDFVNLFGGGKKYSFVSVKYSGNLVAAINAKVEEIMEKNVIFVRDDTSFRDAVETMFEKKVGGCPIVDKENRVVGIITEKDVLKHLAAKSYVDDVVEKYMTKGVVTIRPKDTLKKAMETMVQRKLRRLPVIEDGVLIGMVTVRDVLRYFGKGEAFKMLISGNIKDAIEISVATLLASKDVHHREILTFPPDTPISLIVKTMLEKGYGSALIVEDAKLEGIITERDLVKFMYYNM